MCVCARAHALARGLSFLVGSVAREGEIDVPWSRGAACVAFGNTKIRNTKYTKSGRDVPRDVSWGDGGEEAGGWTGGRSGDEQQMVREAAKGQYMVYTMADWCRCRGVKGTGTDR
jgi:hypothetical protein